MKTRSNRKRPGLTTRAAFLQRVKMKRTELKRSTKRIRQRSKTNSHPGENLKFRQSYARAHEVCELGQWLPDHFEPGRSDETHHIMTGRYDLVSNLLRVSWKSHLWLEQFKCDGRLIAIWIKVQKGEFDREEFRTASGKCVEGFILKSVPRNSWVVPMHEELKRLFP